MSERFLELIAAVGRELPGAHLDRLCRGLEGAGAAAPPEHLEAWNPAAAQLVAELEEAWRAEAPAVTPQALALALRAAGLSDDHHRRRQSLELVWTGPSPAGTTLRRSDQVLCDLVDACRASLLVVAFAAYDVAHVRQAVERAAGRGVEVKLLLESEKESAGRLSFDAALPFARLAGVALYGWPLERRERSASGHTGALHAKCAVGDAHELLVSSANLTGHALKLNMELGVHIRGGELPAQVARHFQELIAAGVLARIPGA